MATSSVTPGSPPTPPLTSADKSPRADPQDLPAGKTTLKRRRSLPPTPPLALDEPSAPLLNRAVHVLATEASALSFTTNLYTVSPVARDGLVRAVDAVATAHRLGGKLVVCGVGKSGIIGKKLVATLKSLGVGASFLHAGEAVHGDMGDIRDGDALLFVTYSGRTEELVRLARHVRRETPVIVVAGHTDRLQFPLLAEREDLILLPAPIHEMEEVSFGVCAPTTSTTVAMAVGDMLALIVAEKLHDEAVADAFRRNHPGGAIGEDVKRRKR